MFFFLSFFVCQSQALSFTTSRASLLFSPLPPTPMKKESVCFFLLDSRSGSEGWGESSAQPQLWLFWLLLSRLGWLAATVLLYSISLLLSLHFLCSALLPFFVFFSSGSIFH
jgi:hypothetical protein